MIAEQWSVIQDLQKKLAEADDKQEEVSYYINRAASETDDDDRDDFNEVAVGQRAQIRIGDETYQGKVTRIDRLASKENSDKAKIPVRIGFEGNTDHVCLGIEADVTILQKTAKDVSVIARSAVYEDETGSYVYVLKDGIVCRQDVETGLSDNEYVQILSGLGQSDSVILDAVTGEKLGTRGVSAEED